MKDTLPEKVQEQVVNKLLSRGANSRCSDCHAKGPCWISMDFGVFICLNCSGQHRNLGPHITRVRSIKLDKWTTEMAQLMDALGNDISEAFYEAKMTSNFGRPDPNGSTPERTKQFIIKKYVEKAWAREGPTPYQIYSKGGNPAEALQKAAPAPAPEATKPQAAHVDLLDMGSAPVITDHQSRALTKDMDLLSFDQVDTTGTGGRRKSNRTSNSTGHSAEQQAEEAKAHHHHHNHPPVLAAAPKNDAFGFIKPKETNISSAAALKQVYQMPMFDLTAQPAKQQVIEKAPELAHFHSNPLPGQAPPLAKPSGNILDLYNNVEIKEPTQANANVNSQADAKKSTLQRGNYAFLESMGGGRPPQPQNGFNPMGQRPPVHPGTQMPNGFVPGLSMNNYGAGNPMMAAGKGPM